MTELHQKLMFSEETTKTFYRFKSAGKSSMIIEKQKQDMVEEIAFDYYDLTTFTLDQIFKINKTDF